MRPLAPLCLMALGAFPAIYLGCSPSELLSPDGGPNPDASDAALDAADESTLDASGDSLLDDATLDAAHDATSDTSADSALDTSADASGDAAFDSSVDAGCATLPTADIPVDIALDSQNVYWLEGSGGVWQASKTTLAKMQISAAKGARIATDGTRVYWTDTVNNQISSVLVGGGSPANVPSPTTPRAITVDATHVYWAGLAYYRAAKGTTVVATLNAGVSATEVAVDATYFYVYCDAPVMTPNHGVAAYSKSWSSAAGTTLIGGRVYPSLAMNSSYVYGLPYNVANAWLGTAPKPGSGAPTQTWLNYAPSDQAAPAFISADDTSVVFRSYDGSLHSWVPGQLSATALNCGPATGRLAIDATHVYFTTANGTLGRAPRL